MTEPSWEHFEHQADVGVRGIGRSRDEAFEQAALAWLGGRAFARYEAAASSGSKRALSVAFM